MSDDKPKESSVDDQKALAADEATPASKEQQETQQAITDFNKTSPQAGMRVRVHSPFRDYFDGLAFSLSGENTTGPFDILPHHHNFICLLLPCELVVRTVNEGERKIRISGGILHVKADEAVVFLDV